MEQSEIVPDFMPKKLARQLDFTAVCRASANGVLAEQSPSKSHQSQPRSDSSLQPQSDSSLQPHPKSQQQVQSSQSHPQTHVQLQLRPPSQQPPPQQQVQKSQIKSHSHAMPPWQARSHQVTVVHRIPHPVQKLPLPTLHVVKQESPRPRQRSNTDGKDGTPKKQKQCNCKNSRCLKLYCECFAAGIYCDGCNCINCHNNVEHEAARQEAVGATLERNPNAFRPKIASSPHASRDTREDAREAQLAAKHNKGCHCKKSGCLKKYCECFQASILCSDNCKCLDCKNFEGSEERKALFHGDHNAVAFMQRAANAAISGAIGSSGYGTPLASKKRKSEELSCGHTVKDESASRNAQNFQENHSRSASIVSPSVPVSHAATAAVIGSSKFTYRSPLADILQPQDIKKLCSLLVVVSADTTKMLTERNGDVGQMERDLSVTSVASAITDKDVSQTGMNAKQMDLDEVSGSGSDGCDVQNERPLSPGTRALMCDEEDTMFMASESPSGLTGASQKMTQKSNGLECPKFYVEQERLILTRFRDFLNRLITCGSIKETMCSPLVKSEIGSQQESQEYDILKSNEEPYINGILKSTVSAPLNLSRTAPTITCNHNPPTPVENGKVDPKIKEQL